MIFPLFRFTPPAPRYPVLVRTGQRSLLVLSLALFVAQALAQPSAPRRFDIPAMAAEPALKLFSDQSGVQVLFPTDITDGVRTNAVQGEMPVTEGMRQLLARTGLVASRDGQTNAYAITRAAPPARMLRQASSQLSDDAAQVNDAPVRLSPFQISAGSDEGYAARETLAGSRFKTELKDVPSQVSIMTEEFLQDIASVTVDDALRYSLNIENLAEFTHGNDAGEFGAGVLGVEHVGRSRGLNSPGRTHDFFTSFTPGDTYNTERVTISSGPNSILFGNGNPSGIVDTSFKRANLQRPRYSVSLRADNHQSLRTSVDLNYPLKKDVLAVRVAALKANEREWREPAGDDSERIYGSLTFRPFNKTTLRGWYEDVRSERSTARNTRIGDQVTPWINAGRPANGLGGAAAPGGNDPVFSRNAIIQDILVLGAAQPVSMRPWGSTGAVTNASAYSVITKGPGSGPHQTGTDSYIYSLRDTDVSPGDVSVNGTGTRQLVDTQIFGAILEQQVSENLFLEAGYNEETMDNPFVDYLRGLESAIRADPNLYLPDRVTPNPNFGRYYVEGQGRGRYIIRRGKEARLMASYDLDLTRHHTLLGRHRFAALYQRTSTVAGGQEMIMRRVPAGTPFETALANYGSGLYNTIRYRAYLSDPRDPATGSTYHLTLPFNPFAPATLPDGSTVYTTHNPFGGTNLSGHTNTLLEGRVFAMQNRLFKDRLVTSFGWRFDGVRSVAKLPERLGGPNGAYRALFDLPVSDDWASWTDGRTFTGGAVGHIFPWLSLFYNQSSTWNPPRTASHYPDGSIIPGAIGEGIDYGVMLRFWQDRISVRLNRYENTNGPANTNFRSQLIPAVADIEETLFDNAEAGVIPPYRAAPGFDPTVSNVFYYDATADRVSKGDEVELVANVTRNWRLSFNASRARATESNVAANWLEFIKQRMPYWAENPSLRGPADNTTTVSSRVLGIIQLLNLIEQAEGRSTDQGREWRANVVTRYGFSEGKLRGAFVGGGYRWRSKGVIGYRAMTVPNEFEFPGVPAEIVVPSLDAPVFSDDATNGKNCISGSALFPGGLSIRPGGCDIPDSTYEKNVVFGHINRIV